MIKLELVYLFIVEEKFSYRTVSSITESSEREKYSTEGYYKHWLLHLKNTKTTL